MKLEITLFFLFAIWPGLGLVLISLANQVIRKKRGVVLAPANSLAEVLARMYLWPIVLWRIRLAQRDEGADS